MRLHLPLLFTCASVGLTNGYSNQKQPRSPTNDNNGRRIFLKNAMIAALATTTTTIVPTYSAANAVERAVGVGEQKCRTEGNCLEVGEWDGAVGWQWGGKDRCDPADPLCSANGQMRVDANGEVPTLPVPQVPTQITDIVQIEVNIGRAETRAIQIGLYGNDYPELVSEFKAFVAGDDGLTTTNPLFFQQGYGVSAAPVTLKVGGVLNRVYPQQKLEFGVPSQSSSYAKRIGKSRAPDDFVPQPRPTPSLSSKTAKIVRKHNVAGLVSVPMDGLGYASSGASDDEAFANAFDITAAADANADKRGKLVIGQVMDAEGMDAVLRLSSLPVSKGIAGVLPGQNFGPPLVKVSVKGTGFVGTPPAAIAVASAAGADLQ